MSQVVNIPTNSLKNNLLTYIDEACVTLASFRYLTYRKLFLYLIMELSTTPWRLIEKWRHNSTILDLNTRWRWMVSFTLLPLYPWKYGPPYLLDRRLCGLQGRSGLYGEEKSLLSLPAIELRLFSTSGVAWLPKAGKQLYIYKIFLSSL
jgi:hypothetical protein